MDRNSIAYRMNPPVVPKRGVSSKGFVADFTRKRLLASVNSFVVLEMSRLRKPLSTSSTNVRLFASAKRELVEVHMLLELLDAEWNLRVRPFMIV